MRMRTLSLLIILTLFVAALPLAAQTEMPSTTGSDPSNPIVGTPTDFAAYGVNGVSVLAIREFSFMPLESSSAYSWADGRYMPGGGWLEASIPLPSGVKLTAFQLEACDSDPAQQVRLKLNRCDVPPAVACVNIADVSTGVAETPGCGLFYLGLPLPLPTVDNTIHAFTFEVQTGTTGNARFRAARIGYQRQLSPAPAVASFGDVPVGSPLHQYVEAVVAAGITAGCGGGNYCPGDPITRGQMAVFLSKALGLYWPY